MKTKWLNSFALAAVVVAAGLVTIHNLDFNHAGELLNVSYAPTADLFNEINRQFVAEYAKKHGIRLTVKIVYPLVSIQAEPSAARVDANISRHHTRVYAEAHLGLLFSDDAQEIIARHGYRPINADVLERHRDRLPKLDLFPITLIAKDWDDAQAKFFADISPLL